MLGVEWLSRETVRRILREAGLSSPRKRRPPKHRQRRARKAQAGQMILWDARRMWERLVPRPRVRIAVRVLRAGTATVSGAKRAAGGRAARGALSDARCARLRASLAGADGSHSRRRACVATRR